MTAPTKDPIQRGLLNVKAHVLEAEAHLEHSPPDIVVGEMILAAASVAQDNGMGAEDLIRAFGTVLCAVMGRDLTVCIEFDEPERDE